MNMQKTNGPGGAPAETISRLQRGVLRLALSFHGQHPKLDNLLKELGTLIRRGQKDNELQRLIDEIVETIVSQQVSQNSDQRGGRTLCDLLQRIESKVPDSPSLKPILRQLSLPIDSASFDRVIEEAADAVAGIVTRDAQHPGEAAALDDTTGEIVAKLLERIEFPVNAEKEVHELKDRIRARQGDVELMHNLDRAAAIISANLLEDDDSEQFDQARDQLLLLMNLIPFPADLTERSSKTRRSIEKAGTPATLYGCIPEIADLTAMMRVQLQTEIDDLGEFLKTTLARLRDFEAHILQSHGFHDESAENTLNFEKRMGDHVEGMRETIEEEMDIEAIKVAVKSRLDNIDDSLGEFVQSEDQRHNQARERINHKRTRVRGKRAPRQPRKATRSSVD